jgi:hypothetical protein
MSLASSARTLARSRWRYSGKILSTPALLRSLGIEFRPSCGDGFWQVNQAILSDLYRQLQEEARERFHELHPDKGGDAREFSAFMTSYKRARDNFARWIGHKPQGRDQEGVVYLPKGRHGILNHAQAFEIARRLREGVSVLRIAREFGVCRQRVRNIRARINGYEGVQCPCGRSANHRGSCRHRFSLSPKWKAYLATNPNADPARRQKMSAAKRGKPFSMAHRLALKRNHVGFTGRKHSPEAKARCKEASQRYWDWRRRQRLGVAA